MTSFSAQEILAKHQIPYSATKKSNYTTNCPACSQGYLNVKIERDGVVWYCHHCDKGGGEPFEKEQKQGGLGPIKALFDYTDEEGKRLFQVMRFEPVGRPKDFRQRTGPEQEKWSLKGVRIVLYRLPELIEDVANDHVIFVTEGEKDVHTLRDKNIPATCNPMGAGKWRDEFNGHFKDADVVVIADNDEPGHRHAQHVASSLSGIASSVRYIDTKQLWAEAEKGDDITDWFVRGPGTVEALWQYVETLPQWTPETESKQEFNGGDAANGHAAPSLIKSSAEFVADFTPPEYVIDGILQRRFCYSLTGRTGAGKTAILLRVAAHVALCIVLGEREVEKGRVLYFAGENPDDVRMRWIALAQQMDFDINAVDVNFIPGTFKISELRDKIQAEAEAIGDFTLVIIDTSAAYFEGDDENSNKQHAEHARRFRGLTKMPGGPCVLVACHPVKNAADDNLIPRGGGSFLAEVDGNLTARKHDDGAVEMHWQGKFRGPDFAPLSFQLRTVTHERLKDTKGRLIPTVIASHLSDVAKEEMATAARSKENQLLAVLVDNGSSSQNELAVLLGWSMRDGKPYKVMVSRMLEVLLADKLIKKDGRGFAVTDAGHKVLGNGGRK